MRTLLTDSTRREGEANGGLFQLIIFRVRLGIKLLREEEAMVMADDLVKPQDIDPSILVRIDDRDEMVDFTPAGWSLDIISRPHYFGTRKSGL